MILIFLFCFNLFHFSTNFNKQKVPEIRGPILLPSRRRQKATHPIWFYLFYFFHLFQKFCEFQKTQGSGDSGTRIADRPEAAKFVLPLRFLKNANFQTFKKKLRISENTRHGGRWLPHRFRLGGGEIPSTLADFVFFFNVSAAQPPRGSIHAPVACGLHCPRPKDCPGLGSPNTLKLSIQVY